MSERKLTQHQFNELCACGKLAFANHNLWLITWLTFYEMVAVCEDVNTGELELMKVVVE